MSEASGPPPLPPAHAHDRDGAKRPADRVSGSTANDSLVFLTLLAAATDRAIVELRQTYAEQTTT